MSDVGKREGAAGDEALRALLRRERESAAGASTTCLEADALVEHASGLGDDARREAASQHLESCRSCAFELDRLMRADSEAGPAPTAEPPRPPRPRLVDRLRSLVHFDMPVSLAHATRSAAAAPHPLYDEAMERYREGDRVAALEGLERAREAGEDLPELPFHLGACLLEVGRAEEAERALADAAKRRPKLGELRYFHAQALLLTGRGEEALKQLRAAARRPGPLRQAAREQSRRVQAELAEA